MKTKVNVLALAILFIALACPSLAQTEQAGCPCHDAIDRLKETYETDPDFKALIDSAFKNLKQLPTEEYPRDKYPNGNPWIGRDLSDLLQFLREWCIFLPTTEGSSDSGLKYIQEFAFFYYRNPDGVRFVRQSPGREIMQDFARQRGKFMDSPASTREIANWLQNPRIEKEDYNLPDPTAPDGGFKSFNEFFARTLKDQAKSRPQTMPERDYVISAPTDVIMNSIPQRIVNARTKIPTKMNQAFSIGEMLDGSKYAKKFIGGTALSCVLMPNTYHHYHAPVNGHVVETKIIQDAFYGFDNFPKWVPPDGNVGYHGTDFSQFENFQRGYFIVDTGAYGHVAIIPVGLNTISSVVFEENFMHLKKPVPIKRGDRLGHFMYGGSLVILVFEPDRYKSDAIQVRLGNQIGTFDTKTDKTRHKKRRKRTNAGRKRSK